MVRTGRCFVVAAALAVLAAACSSPPGSESLNPDCVPTKAGGAPIIKPDLRFEDIVERLTGFRQTEENEESGDITGHPNFGGIWGDRQGGIVVAVLDCSKVDANEIAYLAGGAEYLYLIEVPYTDREWLDFKLGLWQEIGALDTQADMSTKRSQTGRILEVRVRDMGALPDSFGAGVPDDAYVIIESDYAGHVPAG